MDERLTRFEREYSQLKKEKEDIEEQNRLLKKKNLELSTHIASLEDVLRKSPKIPDEATEAEASGSMDSHIKQEDEPVGPPLHEVDQESEKELFGDAVAATLKDYFSNMDPRGKQVMLKVLVSPAAVNPKTSNISLDLLRSFNNLFKKTLRKAEMGDFTSVILGDLPESCSEKKLDKALEDETTLERQTHLEDFYKVKKPRILKVKDELEHYRSFIRKFFPGLSRLNEDWDDEHIVNWMVKVWGRLPKRIRKVIGEFLTVESAYD